MEIKIAIEKKYAWILVLAVVAVGFVIAYGGNTPQIMGHSIGEIDGIDQKVAEVMNAQAATFLSGRQLVEGRYISLGSQTSWPNQPSISLASYTNTYGRGNIGLEMRGCQRAITVYCQSEGYRAAVPISLSCGWAVQQDAPCPNNPCNIEFYCLKQR